MLGDVLSLACEGIVFASLIRWRACNYSRSRLEDWLPLVHPILNFLFNESLRTSATKDRRSGELTMTDGHGNISCQRETKHISSCGAVGSAYA